MREFQIEMNPRLGILFSSAYPGELELPQGARVGFVPKPFTREGLAEALATLMSARADA